VTIIATCGCTLTDDDGEDGMGHQVNWKSETRDCQPSVSYGTLCNKCLKQYREWGIVLETEADEMAYFDSVQTDQQQE